MIPSCKILPFLLTMMLSTFCFAQTGSKSLIIGRSDKIHSKILGEDRIINIYLPQDYQSSDTTQYPVIYVLDGGIEEDFVHIAGIVRFNTQPWIARFPRSIVVGIEGNVRARDFTFSVANTDFIEKAGFHKSRFPQYGGSEKYIDFIEKELQPYIKENYSAGGRRTIIGESLAGLLAAEILMKRPNLFEDFIIISPSLWWDEQSLLKNAGHLLDINLKTKANVYIGIPNKEEDVKMFDDAEALSQTLKRNKKINVVSDYIPDELHSTVMHQAVYNAFKKLYPKNHP